MDLTQQEIEAIRSAILASRKPNADPELNEELEAMLQDVGIDDSDEFMRQTES